MLQASPHGPVTPLHMGQTVLSRTIRTVEAYLVDDLLIDSGPPATAVELARWFRHRELRRIVDTHHHEDHAGGNTVLPEAFGVQVSAPSGALSILRGPPRLELYGRVMWGQPRPTKAAPLRPVVNTRRYRFDVIPTPGTVRTTSASSSQKKPGSSAATSSSTPGRIT